MSGTLLSTGGGGWMQLAPGVSIPGVTPAQPQQQYDMWGRPVGGAASGAGLGNLYNTVSNTMAQQQMPANAPNVLGVGSSGYDQWGRQAPQQVGAGAAQPALNPMQQNLVDAIGSGQPGQGAMLAQILAGVPEEQVGRGGGYGLLGAAAGRGEGSGGGYGGGISGGSTGALGAGGPPGGSGNAAVDAAASASAAAAAEEEQAMGGKY